MSINLEKRRGVVVGTHEGEEKKGNYFCELMFVCFLGIPFYLSLFFPYYFPFLNPMLCFCKFTRQMTISSLEKKKKLQQRHRMENNFLFLLSPLYFLLFSIKKTLFSYPKKVKKVKSKKKEEEIYTLPNQPTTNQTKPKPNHHHHHPSWELKT